MGGRPRQTPTKPGGWRRKSNKPRFLCRLRLETALEDTFMTLRRCIIRGVLFVIPIWLTVTVVHFIYGLTETWLGAITDQIVRWLLPQSWLTGVFAGGHIPGLSLVTLVAVLAGLGFIAAWPVGRQGLRLIDYVFLAIPGVRTLYSAVRKMIDTLGDPKQSRFKKVVIIKWAGMDTVGFVTGTSVCETSGRKLAWVFVPHTPNPTSGFVVLVPEDETVETGVDPADGIKLVMSLGMLAPASIKTTLKRL